MSATLTMLHAAYAGPFAAKRMARDAKVAVKTAEKWWQRLTTPRPDTLIRMARENEALREQMLRALAGEDYVAIVDGVANGPRKTESLGVAPICGADQGSVVAEVAEARR